MTKRYIRHAAQLVTCKGEAPKRGKDMSDIGLIEDGGVLIHDDKIFAVGTTAELDQQVNLN
ncbi:MAG: imidazolonepropionase, partial [Eubacterium sp.]